MNATTEADRRFAVLIDAENVSDKYIDIILDEVSNNGVATYKRIYGDWTTTRLAGWKKCLLENSITPMQQYCYTTGKNSSDSALIIDAMDILHSGNVDGFALVSSDSDFTRLAARLREGGMYVLGMGEQKTPAPFISACNQFKYLDLLYSNRGDDDATADDARGSRPAEGQGKGRVDTANDQLKPKRLRLRTVRKAIDAILDQFSDDDGWLSLGQLGSELNKRLPDFDVRNYGYKKLSLFLKALGDYEFKEPSDESGHRQIYLRLKTSAS